jgi:predicted O-methyltransferase YrrM
MFGDFLKRMIIKVERARLSATPPWAGYLFREMQKRATEETVNFIYENMPRAIFFEDQFKLLRFSLQKCQPGLVAEFGVDAGSTINFIADVVKREVHGFDSFEGLPEDWVGYADFSERFRRQGKPPKVRQNVRLHVGLFEKTLPGFLQAYAEDFAFIHVDCDLYSSTKTIFEHCSSRIKPGTIIVFDEFFNYPNWRQHEYRAFMEYAESNCLEWEYIGYSGNQVGLKITGHVDRQNPIWVKERSNQLAT